MLGSLMALLSIGGVPTGFSLILSSFVYFNLNAWATSPFATIFAACLTLGGGLTLIPGFFINRPSESIILIGITTLFGSFILDFITVINYVNGAFVGDLAAIGTIIKFALFLMILGYGVALVAFFRGNDI